MKYKGATLEAICGMVAPLVGAWIEIVTSITTWKAQDVAPLVGAWIEIGGILHMRRSDRVAPLVGAWIEICTRWQTWQN